MPNPRKPTALRLIQGNPGKRAIPQNEPVPEGVLTKPTWMKGRAARIWKDTAPTLFWLTAADSHKLAVWCGLYAEIEAGLANVSSPRITQWRVLGTELGMDPCARAKLTVPDGKKKDDADKYFA